MSSSQCSCLDDCRGGPPWPPLCCKSSCERAATEGRPYNHPSPILVLNVVVQQFDLVALFADFDAQQVANRKHPDPALTIDDGEMAAANLLHSLEGLVRRLITLDYGAQFAGDLANYDCVGITSRHHNAIQDVAF